MGLYAVEIIEVFSKTVVTEADSFAEAKDKIESAWQDMKIMFDSGNFRHVDFKPSDIFEEREINPIYKYLHLYERI